VKKIRLPRAALGVGFVAGVATVAVLSLSVAALGARSPSGVRWNHTTGTLVAPGLRAQVSAESKIPPGLVWQTITLVEPYGNKVAVIDVGASGDSPGDYVVFQDKLRNPNTNDVVGTIDAQCMAGFNDLCRGVVRLNGRGQITFDGMTQLNVDPDRYSVVGGAGEFVDVGGQMQVDFPADDHAQITLTLTH
jgi:hypothetical protein